MDWLHDYERLKNGPGFVTLPGWKALRLSGPDSLEFLHGLVTCEVKGLAARAGGPCCLLNPKGKLQADFLLYNLGEEGLLAIGNAAAMGNFKAVVGKMIVLSQSRLEELPGPVYWSAGAEGPADWAAKKEGDSWLLSDPRLRPDAAYKIGEAPQGASLDARVWEALRVEAGVPLYGVDADADCLPLEAGLDDAVSFTKGCYMGQEVMSRVHHMGHVNRLLRTLRVEGEAAPGPLYLEGREIGRVTSVCWSPREGASLALGLVRFEQSKPGARVELGPPDASVPAVVL